MENGSHASGGDAKVPDVPSDAPKLPLASFSLRPSASSPDSSNLASLLPPELVNGDNLDAAAGSRRSSMQPRIPSRLLLQTALDLAQKAVEMDKGNDVAGALAAYREAVTKLRVVMERVGVDPTDPKRAGKNEDEGRTLRGIHDAYMARITLLSAYEGETEDGAGLGALLRDAAMPPNGSLPLTLIDPAAAASASAASPTTTASANGDAGPSTPGRSPAPSSIMSRRRRKTGSKHSLGLDEEADLAGVDGIDDDDDDASFHLDTSVGSGGLRKGIEASPVDSEESDRPLPPLPTSDKTRSPAEGLLMSPTAQGSINRRRQQHPVASRSVSSISELNNGSPRGSLVDSPDTSSPRNRTVSALKSFGHANGGDVTVPPMPPLQAAYKSTLAPPIRLQGNAHLAPSPESQPQDPLHRPFHLLRLLHASMDPTKPGAYITSFFHIDSTMWKPASWRQSTKGREIRLNAQDAKTRVCAALVAHLEAIKTRGAPLLEGQRTTPYGDDPTASGLSTAEKDQVGRVAADLASLLDGFDDELDTSHKALHSKGVPVGAWKGKSKAGWGSRLSARVDKMSRNSDSTDRYIDLLQQLFASFQTLDDHLSCITGPCTPAYHALPAKTYRHLEARLTRASQFVGIVVVPCVMDDLRQLLHAYLKGGVRYLEDV